MDGLTDGQIDKTEKETLVISGFTHTTTSDNDHNI